MCNSILRAAIVLGTMSCPMVAIAEDECKGGVVFHLDFNEGGIARLKGGLAHQLQIDARYLEPGLHGHAYRFEPAYENYLPPWLASPDAGLKGFLAGDDVALHHIQQGWNGTPAARAEGKEGRLWKTSPVTMDDIRHPHRPNKSFVGSVYLRAEVPGTKVRLELGDEIDASGWKRPIEEANAKKLEADANAAVTAPMETKMEAGEALLSAEWQRVTARITVDARRPVQKLFLDLSLLSGEGVVEASALQIEQVDRYPDQKDFAGPWIPGGERAESNRLSMLLQDAGLNAEEGTMAAWFRIPQPEGGGSRNGLLVCAGGGWWQPIWELGNRVCYLGDPGRGKYQEDGIVRLRLDASDGQWQHLAMTWKGDECVVYRDGAEVGRAEYPRAEPSPTARLVLGGTTLSGATGSAIVDRIIIWERALDSGEIAALVDNRPAFQPAPEIPLERPRLLFHRGEAEVAMPLRALLPPGKTLLETKVAVQSPALGINEEVVFTADVAPEVGLFPWKASAGVYPVTIRSACGSIDARMMLEIVPALPTTDFMTVAWQEWEGSLDFPFTATMAQLPVMGPLLRHGRHASLRFDARTFHPLDPRWREASIEDARRQAAEAARYPHVRMALINTEVGIEDFPEDEWFLRWMRKETGLEAIPAAVKRHPLRVEAGGDVPAVIEENDPALRFIRWITRSGKGWPQFNADVAAAMREEGLADAFFYTDQPATTEDLRGLDLVEYWNYPHVSSGLVVNFNRVSNIARLAGAKLMLTPGSIFWDPWALRVDDKIVCMPHDMMRQYLWIAVANPLDHLGFWGFGHIAKEDFGFEGTRRALKETVESLYPVGLLTGGLPAAPVRVAYLQTDGQQWQGPGDNQWIEWWFNRMTTRALAESRLRFDWIGDEHVAAGWLANYDVVFIPAAWTMPRGTFDALVGYAGNGGQVVVDKRCRVEIPGAVVLDIEGRNGRSGRPEPVEVLREWAQSTREAYPPAVRVRDEDAAWVFEKIDGDARFIFAVNDRFSPGVLAERGAAANLGTRTGSPHDKGLAQSVELTVPIEEGQVLYDVNQGGEFGASGGKTTGALPPGGAAIAALVPERIAGMTLDAPDVLVAGSEAVLQVTIRGQSGGPIRHRDVVKLAAAYADGTTADVPPWYRVNQGTLAIPIRLPLDAPAGRMTLRVSELLAGLKEEVAIEIQSPAVGP